MPLLFRWRADGAPALNTGSVALCFFRGYGPVLLRNPIFFVICQGGGVWTPCTPPLDPRMLRVVCDCGRDTH